MLRSLRSRVVIPVIVRIPAHTLLGAATLLAVHRGHEAVAAILGSAHLVQAASPNPTNLEQER